MTDPIADTLIRIKNASLIGKTEVNMPFSKMKLAILTILENEGYLRDIKVSEHKSKKVISTTLYGINFTHLKQISKPGRRIYAASKDMPKPLRGMGLVIVSTSKGIITAREAGKQGVGGELICEIW